MYPWLGEEQAGLEFRIVSAYASRVPGLRARATNSADHQIRGYRRKVKWGGSLNRTHRTCAPPVPKMLRSDCPAMPAFGRGGRGVAASETSLQSTLTDFSQS